MTDGLPDPRVVLGVSRCATVEELREAFRLKSKKHHPDCGGDDWAFRIVVRSYEALLAAAETGSLRTRAAVAQGDAPDTGRIRPGVHDKEIDPSRIVLIEVLWMRYELEDYLALLQKRPEDRSLSGSLNMTWPDPELPGDPRGIVYADRILLALNAAFDELRFKTEILTARSHIENGRFEAWISYPTGRAAHAAFKHLRTNLRARGLGVKQWTRDLAIPRGE